MKELTESTARHLLKNLRGTDKKAFALLHTSHKGFQANGTTLIRDMERICVAQRGRGYKGEPQHLEARPDDGKTNCLTTVAKDNMVMQLNPSRESGGKQPYQQNRVYDTDGKSPALCAKLADHKIAESPCRVRRLTPAECARLQTIPDWYKWNVSETQQYKMLGNGWTVEVIKHILSFLPEEMTKNKNKQKQDSDGKGNNQD